MNILPATALFCLFLALHIPDAHALDVEADFLEAASLACTDGTRVFGTQGSGVASSTLLVEKNGRVLYYNDEFEDIQRILSIYCLRNAIVITGMRGSTHAASAAVIDGQGKLVVRGLTGGNRPVRITDGAQGTRIDIYGNHTEKGGEDTVTESVIFHKPFAVHENPKSGKVRYTSRIQLPHDLKESTDLTTITRCQSADRQKEYTLAAHMDETGGGRLSLLDRSTVMDSRASTPLAPLPFVATNSLCFEGGVYLFGVQAGVLRAAHFYFDAGGREQLEVISPWEAPMRPAIAGILPGNGRETAPAAPDEPAK